MKSDLQLKADVTAELVWDPAVNTAGLEVTVDGGIVAVAGQVDSVLQKRAVERALRRVSGVRGTALDLQVRLAPEHERGDTEIAQAALHALHWHSLVPDHKVDLEVKDGWVTLSGEVDWPYQSLSAEQCVQALVGVRGVNNAIRLKQHVDAGRLRQDITEAFARHARREANHIDVAVEGGVVTLAGVVDSLAEHDAAIGTASAARGVTRVIDRLQVA